MIWTVQLFALAASLAVSSPRVRVFLFNKDNPGLLRDWVIHHTSLFGNENVHILDHSSTDPVTIATLRTAAARGVNVTVYDGPFTHKAIQLSELMRSQLSQADFLVPLDVDEFIGTYRHSEHSFSARDVLEEFRLLWPSAREGKVKYKFGIASPAACDLSACQFSNNSPASSNLIFFQRPDAVRDKGNKKKGCMHKTFYPAKTFSFTDQGNHVGGLVGESHSARRRLCDAIYRTHFVFPDNHALILAHLDLALPYQMHTHKYANGAKVYGFTNRSRCTGKGIHYCRFMKTSLTSYAWCRKAMRGACEPTSVNSDDVRYLRIVRNV
jgi:hypothetical protein